MSSGDSTNFVQPYNHVDLNLDDYGHWVEKFINYDLEAEHGDIGLDSPNNTKPPLSRLGRQLMATRNRKALTELQEKLVRQAEGNVSLARLRLINEHRVQSAESVFSPLADVLPVNVVGFFHAGMRRIEKQPPERRDLGFKVIAAVTHYHYVHGISYEALDRLLRNPTKTLARQHPVRTQSAPVVSASADEKKKAESTPATHHVPHRSVEEMLHAACGFVVMVPLGKRPLKAYSQAFHEYARHYHEDLRWAHAQLDFDSIGVGKQVNLDELGNKRLKRRETFQHTERKSEFQAAGQRLFVPQKRVGESSSLRRQGFKRLQGAEVGLPVIPDALIFDSDDPVIMAIGAVAEAASVAAPEKKKLLRARTQAFV